MNTNTLAASHQPTVRAYDPSASLRAIIDNLGSATPWAMLALCSMSSEPRIRAGVPATRPAPRTVREIRAIAPRSAAC